MSDLSEAKRIAAQRVEHGRRARQAFDEYVAPALTKLRAASIQRIGEIVEAEPWATDKIAAQAMFQRVLAEAEKVMVAAVLEGEAARHDLEQIERVSSMSAARRKALGI
jgi:hypothetical protein